MNLTYAAYPTRESSQHADDAGARLKLACLHGKRKLGERQKQTRGPQHLPYSMRGSTPSQFPVHGTHMAFNAQPLEGTKHNQWLALPNRSALRPTRPSPRLGQSNCRKVLGVTSGLLEVPIAHRHHLSADADGLIASNTPFP